MISEAKKRADKKYRAKNISRIALDFQKEYTEKVKEYAKEKGKSVQGYIKELIDEDMNK